MDEARWEELERRREQNRYFMSLELAADESQRHPARASAEAEKEARKQAREQEKRRKQAEAAQLAAERVEAKLQQAREVFARKQERERERQERKAAREEERKRRESAEKKSRKRRAKQETSARPHSTRPGRPDYCTICGRRMRRRGTLVADYPGTIQYWGHGMCQSCATGQDPSRRADLIHDGSTSCDDCGVTLRPRTTSAVDYPGTRAVVRRIGDRAWLCSTCYDRERNGRQRQKRFPPNCVRCDVPMVPKHSKSQPGKRQHGAHGLCTTCVSRDYRKAHAKPLPPLEPCSECGVEMIRGRKDPVPEGHRRHAGKGICTKCRDRAKRGYVDRRPLPPLAPCQDCGVPLTRIRVAAQAPEGHRRHAGEGLCARCLRRSRRPRATMVSAGQAA